MNKPIHIVITIVFITLAHCTEQQIIDKEQLNTSQAWGFGMLSGVCLLITGLLAEELLFCVKDHMAISTFSIILNCLYALACGTMVGDVILHALPQAFTSPHTKVSIVGLMFLISIFSFIMMERAFKLCGLTAHRWGSEEIMDIFHGGQGPPQQQEENLNPNANKNQANKITLNEHWQTFAIKQSDLREQLKKIRQKRAEEKSRKELEIDKTNSMKMFVQKNGNNNDGELPNSSNNFQLGESTKKMQPLADNEITLKMKENEQKANSAKNVEVLRSFSTYERRTDFKRSTKLIEDARKRQEQKLKSPQSQDCIDKFKGKGAEGYLEILTSFVHNFFDGFALGVGFGTRDRNQYIPILIAVYVHAVPRELGDISILIKSRFDDCQAKVCSAVPKIMIVVGVAAGLGLETTSDAAQYYIVSFVAGSFIYIASDIWKNLFKTKILWRNVSELLLLILGIGLQFLLLLVE